MKIIINNNRGRDWKNLEKYWFVTKEKLEKSDTDFELAFNRLHFIARSSAGLASANVVINLLLYLSIMYKACYQSLCILKSYETFIEKLLSINANGLSGLTMERVYHEAFQESDIQTAVSDELYIRFSEMIVSNLEKSFVMKNFFYENKVDFLHLIAGLNQLAIGYQQGNETTKRAFLFSKILRLVRHVIDEQFTKEEQVMDTPNHDQMNIHSIIPNLKSKIGLFDFGLCIKTSKVITLEFNVKSYHFFFGANNISKSSCSCSVFFLSALAFDALNSTLISSKYCSTS